MTENMATLSNLGMRSFSLRISETMSARLFQKTREEPGTTVSSQVQMFLLQFIKEKNGIIKKDEFVDPDPKTVTTSFWLTEQSLDAIDDIALRSGLQISSVIRKIIMCKLAESDAAEKE